ncbi:transcriptional regulator, ArsR family [Cyclonatronum proteinivorum]|uniref:Transcriptional regulator, ArsR family n=1 Tax=Cyclonatronum proteinivorum TaxID=1457365 RepID=A0A345UJN8_9BACT|nr:metalloregulator ArsR/SmtB family transcription factor [Cyclonatronum proteinivorum]AXJ00690.1 transcriptional regulator, ArsR family [Cyclonatronum proteinivorum]
MNLQKISIDDRQLQRSAEIAKALGHPARIAILKILAERTSCFCGDITEILPLAQSTVSQHLKALKNAGLIKGEVEGVKTCYCLNPDGIRELQTVLSELSAQLVRTCC